MDAQQRQARQRFKNDSKRAAVELWRAGVPLATIRKQLKMSESTLRRLLAFARKNPTLPVPPQEASLREAQKDQPGDQTGMVA